MQQSPDRMWLPLDPPALLRRSTFGPLALLLLVLQVSRLLLSPVSRHPAGRVPQDQQESPLQLRQ